MAAAITSIVVSGAAGRMGRRILALAAADDRVSVVGAVEAAANPALGADAGELAGIGRMGVSVSDDLAALAAPDRVIVEFSSPEASLEHLRVAAEARAPIVIGTTGFDHAQKAEVDELAAGTATLIAPNMSLGVNVLLGLVEDAARRLGAGFDCEVVEIHHNRKKDSPSGTALALGEAAARGKGFDPASSLRLAREGLVGERPRDEIAVLGLRGGDAVGDHTVMLVGTGERLELTHRAASRDCLASGAIEAAVWLAGRGAGLYSMRDVIA